jgi:hypothetical protein
MKVDTTYVTTSEVTSILYIVTGDPVFTPQPPIVNTGLPSFVTQTSARLHGSVNPYGYATAAWFEWGTSTSYGNSTTPQSVGSGQSFVSHSAQLSDLTPGVTYHFRSAGQNTGGTTYGNDQMFTTILDTVSRTVIPIHVTDNYTDLITVWVGVHPEATFCIDPSLGEEYLPPPPPSATFDVRLVNPRAGDPQCFDQGTHVDLRPFIDSPQVDTFRIRLQGDYNLGFTLFWPNLDSFFTEPVRLLDPYGGLAVNVDMKAETTYTLTTATYVYIPFLHVVVGTPTAPPRPAVLTNSPSNIQYNVAQVAGLTNPNGFETTVWFEWGTSPNYGNVTSAQSVGSGSSTIPIDQPLVGLSPSTVYWNSPLFLDSELSQCRLL